MFNVGHTEHTTIVDNLIAHAHKQRFAVDEDKQKAQSILITDEWAKELQDMPFLSAVSNLIIHTDFMFRKKEKWYRCSSRKQKSRPRESQEQPMKLYQVLEREGDLNLKVTRLLQRLRAVEEKQRANRIIYSSLLILTS